VDPLPFDEPPRKLFPAYPTRLSTWQDCPRRYRFAYVEPRPKAGPWAHFSVGTSVHDALRRWFDLPVGERTPERAADRVRVGWIDAGFRDEHQSHESRERAAMWVHDYVMTQDARVDPIGLERTVGVTTTALSLRGRVDRIDARRAEDGREELVVVDYKTSRRPSTQDEARSSLQLAVYAAATARSLRRPCSTVELHHVPTATVVQWTYADGQLARHLRRADEIGLEAQAAEAAFAAASAAGAVDTQRADAIFPPVPNPRCSWCDVRSWCEEGRAVSVELKPWDGLPREAAVPAGEAGDVL
jgi:putative RecB family exonuclease